jgi:FkbM family methyltransferase
MKKAIKSFLRSAQVLKPAKKIYKKLRNTKYKNADIWHRRIEKLDITFDTSDPYSKVWFYPRYDNGRIHEPVATKLFIEYIQENSQVLDIGSHLGYFTCIAGKLAANGTVNAFEVDPKCLLLIKKNVEKNNLKNITVNHLAVSDKNETIRIPVEEKPNPGLVINSGTQKSYIEVKSISIDDFIEQKNIQPDFIKIDVEGAEWNVLKGMKNLLKQDNLVLLIEIHAQKLKKFFNADYKDCIDMLLQNGFTLENTDHRLSEGAFKHVDRETVLKTDTMLLCKKGNKN